MTVGCIVCRKPLVNIDDRGNQPSGGVEFTTYGHYGSAIFDPMDGSEIAINICDPCLSAAKAEKFVLSVKPGRPQPMPRPNYTLWK